MIEIYYIEERERYEACNVPKGQYVILRDCGFKYDVDEKIWFTTDFNIASLLPIRK